MKTKTLKDSLLIFLAIVTGIYIIFSFVKLSSLTEQVKELQFNRDQLLSKIEEQNVAIDEIHQNVDEQLRKQASLF
jgi:cell division protein FtsL